MSRRGTELRVTRGGLAVIHVALAALVFFLWWLLTETKVLPPFFFGEPLKVVRVVVDWFVTGKIWPHLAITLWETVLAFAFSDQLARVFRPTGLRALSKIISMLLAAIAVSMIRHGLKT